MKLFLFCVYANLALALNILISTPDSWVTKNVRHLKAALEAQNHTVVAIAPLYDNMGSQKLVADDNSVTMDTPVPADVNAKRLVQSADAIADGGDFGHLLPVHQIYYKHIKAMNLVSRKRPRNVVHREDVPQESVVSYDAFGQDPLDPSFWYVDSLPVSTFLIGLDIILPKYYPGFKPDLVILGPQEGISYTSQGVSDYYEALQAMAAISASQNHSTIAVSSEDSHHIYFQDEHFFNAQQEQLKRFKKNVFARNIRFTNKKILDLVTRLENKAAGSPLLPPQVALNVIIPSINHEYSHCATSSNPNAKLNPEFKQVLFQNDAPPSVVPQSLPKYHLSDDKIEKQGLLKLSGVEKRSMSEEDEIVEEAAAAEQEVYEDKERPTFVDKKSYYYLETLRNYAKHPLAAFHTDKINVFEKRSLHQLSDNDDLNSLLNNVDELAILNNCHISIAVNHMALGCGLGSEVFDVESLFMHNS